MTSNYLQVFFVCVYRIRNGRYQMKIFWGAGSNAVLYNLTGQLGVINNIAYFKYYIFFHKMNVYR